MSNNNNTPAPKQSLGLWKDNPHFKDVISFPKETPLGNKFAAKVESANLLDAKAWAASEEKAIFCVEFLEAFSVNQIDSFWQEELEDRFEALLESENHN